MRLMGIKFYDHNLFYEKELFFKEIGEETKADENFTTVIIGPNGTGKSTLLREIGRMFRDTYERQDGIPEKKVLEFKYGFCFKLDDKKYSVDQDSGKRKYRINDKITTLSEWKFPNSIIAVSSIPNDKFIFSKNDDKSIYKYAGIRSSNNTSGTKTLIKNIVNMISTSTYSKINQIATVLKLLNFKKEMHVSFSAKSASSFYALKNKEDLDSYFQNLKNRRKTVAFSINVYNKLTNSQKDEILNFLKQKMSKNYISFNLMEEDDFNLFVENYKTLSLLLSLDLVKAPELIFNKNDTYNSNNEISSGEYNLVFQFLRIFLLISDNSLLLIDEPEISLHPNWQIQYLSLLEKCLSQYKGIYTIVATHSHLLLTGLNTEFSNVMTISKDLNFNRLDYSISGWSPENILYRVFNLTSVRNRYFELDLRRIIHFIEENDNNINEIKEILNRLSKFNITDEDPLKKIIIEATKKVEKCQN